MISIAAAIAFAFASTASAASFTNVEFQNGDVTVQGTGGQTVTAKVRVVVGAGEVVEKIQSDVISDSLAPVCVEVGGEKGLEEGTHFVDLQVKLPPNTGTYTLAVQGSGIFGAFKTVDCTSNVVGSASFGSALKVVGAGTGSSDSSIGANLYQTLLESIALLKAQIAAIQNPAPKPVDSKCAALTAKMAGTMMGQTQAWDGSPNSKLQGFLLAEGMSIPALTKGAAFGFYGPQTAGALSSYKAANACI